MGGRFVPDDFVVPLGLEASLFRLEPLGPRHNEADYAAWMTSSGHIHATPGFEDSDWPREMTSEENLRDLERHADDFGRRVGFTYTVLDPDGDVVGCLYIYPHRDGSHDAHVSSWVRASRAELDVPLWKTVRDWLAAEWPFENAEYASRAHGADPSGRGA